MTPPGRRAHLEVGVLVDGASGGGGDHAERCHVDVLVGEEEEVHAAALRHTLLGQVAIETDLRLEQRLGRVCREGGGVKE